MLRIIFKCRIVEKSVKIKLCALLVYGPHCLAFCIMNAHKHGTVAPLKRGRGEKRKKGAEAAMCGTQSFSQFFVVNF